MPTAAAVSACPSCPVDRAWADHCHAPLIEHHDGTVGCLDACLLPRAAHDLSLGCAEAEDGCCAPPAALDPLFLPAAAGAFSRRRGGVG
ncbi:MAG: hypothetical protein H0V33_02575 [Acidimicrobiia bacterium]|jgi:hypothetical protein|nr:hypothetical protein [Acidimicrobiia bacterium]